MWRCSGQVRSFGWSWKTYLVYGHYIDSKVLILGFPDEYFSCLFSFGGRGLYKLTVTLIDSLT